MDKTKVNKIYGNSANMYEKVMLKYWEYDRKQIIDLLELKGGEKVLEVGVGTGKNLEHYPENIELTGIDFTYGMLQIAKEKAGGYKNRNIELLEMDAENMKFDDNTFDAVLESLVLCVAPNPEKILREIARVSKPGSKIAIFDYTKSKEPEMIKWQELITPYAKTTGFPPGVIIWDPLIDYNEIIEKEGLPFKIEINEIIKSDNPFLQCCTMLLVNTKG